MKKKIVILFIVLVSFVGVGFSIVKLVSKDDIKPVQQETTQSEIKIVTSFYPMYIAVLNITDGTRGVTVANLTDNQTGCLHDYQLTTKDMRALTEADVLVMNGGDMEVFLEESVSSMDNLYTVTASEGISFLEGSEHDHDHEDEEVAHEDEEVAHEEDEADHESVDNDEADESHAINGHVWLNTNNYLIQIDNIATQLAEYDKEHATMYFENAESYKKKVIEVQKELETKLVNAKGVEVIAFHDAFAYLADELGMEVVYTVDMDSDTSLSSGEIATVIDEVRLHNIQYLLTEEQFSTSIAANIAAETNASVYVIDSLVTGKNDKNAYLDGMRANIETLEEALLRKGE